MKDMSKQQLLLAAQQLRPSELADLISRLSPAERKQVVIDLLAAGLDPVKVLSALRDLELQREVKIRRRMRTIWWTLATAAGGLSAFHGYRRNRSVGWALGWFAAGTILPLPTVVIAIAQGYGKPKASVMHKQLGAVASKRLNKWVTEDPDERYAPTHYAPIGTDNFDVAEAAVASVFPEWHGSSRMSGAPSNWRMRVGNVTKTFPTKTAAKDAALAQLTSDGKALGLRSR